MIETGGAIRDLLAKPVGTAVEARGWVRTHRRSKRVHFLQLNDGSCFETLQVVADADRIASDTLDRATTGACIRVTGELVASPGKGQAVELQAHDIQVYGSADATSYPLQKKGHSMEFLREIAHLRPRSNTFGAVFRVRNALSFAIHRFFQERGFLYIHTPIITGSDAEGAGEMFGVTTLDLLNLPRTPSGEIDRSQDFFRSAGLSDGQRSARSRDLRPGLLQRVYLWADVSSRELQHPPPPGRILDGRTRDCVLRS